MTNDQQLLEGGLQTESDRQNLVSDEPGTEAQLQEQSDIESEEIAYANQLAFEQSQAQQEAMTLSEVAKTIGKPSLFKYGLILIMFAIPNDIIDIIEVSGYLIILSWIVSAFLSVATILVMWFADSELKRVKGHMANREKYGKALAKTATQAAAKLQKFMPKNPITKVIAGTLLEMIPIISLLPWATISVILAYQDEKKTFKEARRSYEEGAGSSSEAIAMV